MVTSGAGLVMKITWALCFLHITTTMFSSSPPFFCLLSPLVSSSCAGFLKTWLPFLMLMGIILTVALAINLRWHVRQVERTVKPLQVGCGVDLLDNEGCITRCRANITEEIKTVSFREETVERGCLTHVHQHMLGLWKAGGLVLAVLQWWSRNALGTEIHSYSVICFERSDWNPPPSPQLPEPNLMDNDYWKLNSRYKPSPPAKCRSCVSVLIIEVRTLLNSLRKTHPCLAFRFLWPYFVMDWECNPMFLCFQNAIFILGSINMLNQLDAFLGNLLHFMLDLM